MKKTIKFYTEEQNQQLLKELHKGTSLMELSKRYSKLWNRSQPSLYIKLMKMRTKPTKTRMAKKGIELPKGWSFDIAHVKRVILHSDNSVTLHF